MALEPQFPHLSISYCEPISMGLWQDQTTTPARDSIKKKHLVFGAI